MGGLLAACAAASLSLAGCARIDAQAATQNREPPAAATFKAGRGVRVSPAAAQFVRLETTAIDRRDFPGSPAAVAIPDSALLRTARGTFVFVENGGWFLRTAVGIGARHEGWIAVSEGLYEGDIIVSEAVDALWLAEIQALNGGVSCTEGH